MMTSNATEVEWFELSNCNKQHAPTITEEESTECSWARVSQVKRSSIIPFDDVYDLHSTR